MSSVGCSTFSPSTLKPSISRSFSFPIVAACVLRWIEFRIFDPSYFKLDQGTTPVHLIIIDEVSDAAILFLSDTNQWLPCL